MPNAISTFILAHSLHLALEHADKAGLVDRLADDFDKLVDYHVGKKSEGIQQQLVEDILLPLAKRLMKENPDAYKRILIEEAEPFRGVSSQGREDRQPSGTNFAKPRHTTLSGFTDGLVEA